MGKRPLTVTARPVALWAKWPYLTLPEKRTYFWQALTCAIVHPWTKGAKRFNPDQLAPVWIEES